MSVDNDLDHINKGLEELFTSKPITHQPEQNIRDEEQKAAWQMRRTRRSHSDVYSMVCGYVHHEGDRQWLVMQLQTLPIHKRESVMKEYARIYQLTKERENNENIKDGEARRASNSWLVALLKKLKHQ